MSWFHNLIELIYPSPFTSTDLKKIPSAPTPPLPFVFSLFDYHSPYGKKLIYAIKRYNNYNVASLLANAMFEYTHEYIAEQRQFSYFTDPIVTIVPMTATSLKKRGFNQNDQIARQFAKLIKATYIPSLITKHRETEKQALIRNKHNRIKNVKNAFSLNDNCLSISQHDIIIIDDLVTSGATLSEIQRILKRSGARKVIAITIAH